MEISLPRASNQRDQVKKIQEILISLREHCRSETLHSTDSRVRALLETTADMLDGLEKAYQDYLSGSESWQKNDIGAEVPQNSKDPWD